MSKRFTKAIILIIEVLAIAAALPVLFVGVTTLVWGFSPLVILLLVVLPLLFLAISVYMFIKTLKTKGLVAEVVTDYKKLNRPLLIGYLLLSVVVIGFVS